MFQKKNLFLIALVLGLSCVLANTYEGFKVEKLNEGTGPNP